MQEISNQWKRERGGRLLDEVYPVNDLREHVLQQHRKGECWCNPYIDECGAISHNALDEREKFEYGERKPS
jgi:hypothetical protein